MIDGDYRQILKDTCKSMIKNFQVYIKALEKAWDDYQLSTDERAILGSLRESLEISEKQHNLFETQILGELGKNAFESNQYSDAQRFCDAILEIDNNNETALFYGGKIFKNAGNTDKAREYFQRVIEINPDHEEANDQLASVGGAQAPSAAPVLDELSLGPEVGAPSIQPLPSIEEASAPSQGDIDLEIAELESELSSVASAEEVPSAQPAGEIPYAKPVSEIPDAKPVEEAAVIKPLIVAQEAKEEATAEPESTAPAAPEEGKAELPKYPCRSCGKDLTWIPQYQRWYCYGCGKYA